MLIASLESGNPVSQAASLIPSKLEVNLWLVVWRGVDESALLDWRHLTSEVSLVRQMLCLNTGVSNLRERCCFRIFNGG
jgi:hypothetical protein